MVNSAPLYERLRPRSLDDVIGQPKAVALARRCIERGVGGRAFFVSGMSGGGKTTICRIMAASIADPIGIEEYDSADAFGQAALDQWCETMHFRGFGRGGRALIINEAHGLRAPIVRQLLGVMERLPAHAAVFFTTTRDGEDKLFEDGIEESPLLSRCTVIRLTNQGVAKPAAEYVQRVAQAHNLDGQPREVYERLAKDCKSNIRMMLQRVEDGEMLK